MNDDFLSRFRQAPRPEFAEGLYVKLNRNIDVRQRFSRDSIAKRLTFALTALCVVFAVTMAVSPAVRAAVSDILAKIIVRGTTVLVNDETPAPAGEYESYSLIWTPAAPADILTHYSFYARLPTWLPSGYMLQEQAALYYASMFDEAPFSSLFEWKNHTGESIQLRVMKGSCPNGPSHDPASGCTLESFISVRPESEPEVVSMDGQPAILYRGVASLADLSSSTRKWNPSRGKSSGDVTKGWSLIWEKDERTFFLAIESAAITKEDVLRVAESVP